MRPMRFAPDGPFVRVEDSPPLPQGPGTDGVMYRAGGLGDQALTGAALPLVWAQEGAAPVDELPWFMPSGRFYEVLLDLWLAEGVAAPGGNLVIDVSAEGVTTLIRTSIFTRTIAVAPNQNNWPVRAQGIVDAVGWVEARNNVQVTLNGVATLTWRGGFSAFVLSQYVP